MCANTQLQPPAVSWLLRARPCLPVTGSSLSRHPHETPAQTSRHARHQLWLPCATGATPSRTSPMRRLTCSLVFGFGVQNSHREPRWVLRPRPPWSSPEKHGSPLCALLSPHTKCCLGPPDGGGPLLPFPAGNSPELPSESWTPAARSPGRGPLAPGPTGVPQREGISLTLPASTPTVAF